METIRAKKRRGQTLRFKFIDRPIGHLRTFEECAPALKKHIIDLYDTDVFILDYQVF